MKELGKKSMTNNLYAYYPDKFKQIQDLDGISTDDMTTSLSPLMNTEQIFKSGQGSGKGGSFFFFSYDQRFLIKTLRNREKDNMLEMIDDYLKHIEYTT